MTEASEDRFELDEREHQALDTLDSIPLASLSAGLDAVFNEFAASLAAAGEDPAEIEAALAAARALLLRLIAIMADRLLEAAEILAASEDRGALEPEALARSRALIAAEPARAPGLASAVEAVGVSLGLDRASLAWAVLIELGERAGAEADDPTLQACSQAIAERLTAAMPAGPSPSGSDGDPGRRDAAAPAPALRVFRSAAVRAAGPELRARFLAADHPDQLALARALVEAHADPAALVAKFDAALAALAEAQPEAPDASPEALIDGPKRRFTALHVVLALIVLGLTIWHYGFR